MQSIQSETTVPNRGLVKRDFRWLRLARPLALLFILFCISLFFAGLVVLPDYAPKHPESFTAYTWTPEKMEQILGQVGLALLLLVFIALVVFGGDTPPVPLVLLLFMLVDIGIASHVYRSRRVSTPLERQQTKWVILAVLVVFITLLLSMIPMLFPSILYPGSPRAFVVALLNSLTSFVLVLFPLSIGFAILRYRLWDVDLLIRRTLLYGVLTATLLALYFTSVVALQELFQLITGQHQSSISTVLSTLAIAALFSPLRRRIQNAIDHRFYRRRYDAEQTLQAFAATLRNEVDIDQLSNHLVAVIQETMQPESLSLWLKNQNKHRSGVG